MVRQASGMSQYGEESKAGRATHAASWSGGSARAAEAGSLTVSKALVAGHAPGTLRRQGQDGANPAGRKGGVA
jgi:hypothetical protein